MIFSTIADVKPFMPVNVNNDFNTIAPYLRNAPEKVYPICSRALYAEITAAYISNPSLPNYPAELIYQLRRALVNFAYYTYSFDGSLQIDDSGFKQVEDDNYKSAHQWQMRDFRHKRKSEAFAALQELYYLLNQNGTVTPPAVDYFATWQASPEFDYLKSLYLLNVDEWNRYRQIANFESLWALRSAQRSLDDLIADNITQELLDDYKNQLATYGSDPDLEALAPYLNKAVAHLAVARGVSELRGTVTAAGLYFEADDATSASNFVKREPVSDENYTHIAHSSERQGNAAIAALRKYLNANASTTKYADYYNSSLYTPPSDSIPKFENKPGGIFLAR